MTESTSLGGGAVLCDGAPGLSFWAHIDGGALPSLPYNRLVHTLNRSEHYIAWQTNEVGWLWVAHLPSSITFARQCIQGDTPKILAALMQNAWLSPLRGSIPIAWGVPPIIADTAPGLLQFYASTGAC
jgi:hypothetical protein